MAWEWDLEPTLCKIHSENPTRMLDADLFNLILSSLWPEFVKQRIQDTYMYFGASIGISAASAAAVFRTPALINLVSRGGWMALIGTMALVSD